MCVSNVPGKTEALRRRHNGLFTAYKVLRSEKYTATMGEVTITSLIGNKSNALYGNHNYKPGIHLALQRPLSRLDKCDKPVKLVGLDYIYSYYHPSGIHVYLSKKQAMKENKNRIKDGTRVLVSVTVDIQHLIISDGEQAAFRAIYISPEQWKAAGFKS